MKDRVVFSTNPKIDIRKESDEISKFEKPEKQDLRIWLEKRPGNKIVSIIKGFIGSESDFKELGKILKMSCGVGGSIKNNTLIIQTKDRQKLLQILKELGYFAKLSGG